MQAQAAMPSYSFGPSAAMGSAMGGLPVPYQAIGLPEGVTSAVPIAAEDAVPEGESLATLTEWFNAYLDQKQDEMAEQRVSRRYYHGVQWTDDERKTLEDRGQPPVENNRIGPKVDGIVGVIVRLRQDPKAYPRTQATAAGAQIGNAALREVLDANAWESLQQQVAQDLAIDGIGGLELDLEAGDEGSPDIINRRVEPTTFFYDPRSIRADFSDARYMGVYKWMDLDAAIELLPDQEEKLKNGVDHTTMTSTGLEDTDRLWYDTRLKRVKVVEAWYRYRGDWRYALHSGDAILADGVSPFRDRKGKTVCRYVMTSAGIDHNGTRYGFVRNMKSPQDEINHRRSALLHGISVNQILYEEGAVDDINEARRQLALRDGAIKINAGGNRRFEIREKTTEIQGQAQLLAEAKAEIENFGPGQALLGSGGSSQSGRAMALQQQAGIAQLGPYFGRYKDWKLRVYRADWNTIQMCWTNERMIRIAGEDDVKFLPVNQMVMTPTGPRIANAIGQLDLDIVMDEGPDVATLQEDVMQAVTALINGKLLPPQAALPVVIELSNLPPAMKAKLLSAGQPQPDSHVAAQHQAEQQAVKQLQFQGAQAKVRETNAKADQAQADAVHKVAQAKNSGALVNEHIVHTAQALADIEHKRAQTRAAHVAADAGHLDNLGTLAGVFGPPPPQSMPASVPAQPQFGF